MIERIRQQLLRFINSEKDTPLLAGFSVGFYMILFYYSKNFGLANSLQQFLFFCAYYILLPTISIYAGYKILPLIKLEAYRKQFLFLGILGFLAFFMVLLNIGLFTKLMAGGLVLLIILLSFWLKKYYKFIIVMLFFMSVFNLPQFGRLALIMAKSSSEWQKLPDDIENVVFKQRPNIYYIQPDGYTNFDNLKDSIHRFDNSKYENFMKSKGFTLYPKYRSNYYSTLLSNSATFSMKHHYEQEDLDLYRARSIIISDNPVLRILKKNNYKTSFITQNPYLIMNRPTLGYDYCNIDYSDLPYLKDGFGIKKDVQTDLQNRLKESPSHNFFFIEKFSPGHISVYKQYSKGAEEEKRLYVQAVKDANIWLTEMITNIEKNDPTALIIIGADHGGFAGFTNTHESMNRTDNPYLKNSIFGAHLAIRWNNPDFNQYDTNLKTGVNLFRIVFSYLAEDKKYIDNLQENGSYIQLNDPKGKYRYIDGDGKPVFDKK